MSDYVLLDTHTIPLETAFTLKSDTTILQADYVSAIQHVRVDASVRNALNQVNVATDEHRLNTWEVSGKGVYTGAWAKRLAKYLYKKHKVKIDSNALGIISERIRKALGNEDEILFKFSKSLWMPGEFGEATNSCWFKGQAYGHSAEALVGTEEGGAIKFFTTAGIKRARCWYYNVDGSILVFNAYDKLGRLDILTIARLLSTHYKVEYAKHSDVIVDKTFVNGKSIYAIGNPPISRPVTMDFAMRAASSFHRLRDIQEDFRIPQNNECPHCHRPSDHVFFTSSGERGCNNCAITCPVCSHVVYKLDAYSVHGQWVCEHHDTNVCSTCGERYLVSDGECPTCSQHFVCYDCREEKTGLRHTYQDRLICETCYDDNYFTCDECGDITHSDDGTYVERDERYLCNVCYDDRYTDCSNCHTSTPNEDVYEIGSNFYCNSCFDEVGGTCERCGTGAYNDDLYSVHVNEDGDEESWCNNCTDRYATLCNECDDIYADNVGHNHDEEDEDED